MRSKKMIRAICISFAVALTFTVLVGAGILYRLDRWVEDAWYQEPRALSGNIVVVGIDEKALEQFGPYSTWTRDIMAGALEFLASDPEHMPAVVAIDTLYSGESGTAADQRLADAAAKLGCVITADAAQFGTESIKVDSGRYATDDYVIKGFEKPYPALRDVTVQGHINAMNDSDGILRHAILFLDPPGEERVFSMASTAARMFAEKNGLDITLPETSSRGMFWVSFSAMPNTYYENISIADLYNGDVPGDYFANKVVYIGPYAAGLQDVVSTPIDRGQTMNGVEFQANVTEQILNGDYKDETGNPAQLILLFVIVFASLVILSYLPLVPASVYAAGLIAVSLAVCRFAYNGGHILHPLWVPVGVFLSYVVSVGTQYILTMIEKHRVTQTFQRYVDPEIVSELLKEGTDSLQLGGKLCDIAVLFVDIRGFTSMSERLSPEQVVSILNRYLGMTSECVARNKGTLDKFVGDCTMAFWGAPLPMDDAIYRGVKCAMDIVDGAKTISKELVEEIGEELNVGVGVNFGPAVVGNIGADRHMDYTAIGDTVNTAARLEANAPGGTVFISRSVADALEGRIETTSLGDTIKLKGKADGFEILRVEKLYE